MKTLITFLFVLIPFFAQAEKYQGGVIGDVDPNSKRVAAPVSQWPVPTYSMEERAAILAKYSHLDPNHLIRTRDLEEAVLFFEKHQDKLTNKKVLTVIDFAKHSSQQRFFVINLQTGQVEALQTAHGRNSDPDNDGNADRFSNTDGSLMSSLGFYLAAESYQGENGYSLRLDGLSPTNSNARTRAIVIHGADYVNTNLTKVGRSYGCPALARSVNTRIINTIKNGSLIYAAR